MCVCVSDSSLGGTHLRFHCYFAVILCHFHQDKKKNDKFACLLLFAVSYCRQIYIETASQYLQKPVSPYSLPCSLHSSSQCRLSLDLVRIQTKSTQVQGHSAVLCPPSGTGYQTHSKMQKTLQLSSS